MKKVADLLRFKGREVWSIDPNSSVYDAMRLMAVKEVGALLVLDQSKPVGMLSERDYARKVILKGRASDTTLVGEIMTSPIISAAPDYSIDDCMEIMTERRIRHLPVIESDELIGLISMGDLVQSIIAEQQDTINHLERYIIG
jgi:CBS domain-containing protein